MFFISPAEAMEEETNDEAREEEAVDGKEGEFSILIIFFSWMLDNQSKSMQRLEVG